MSTRNFQVDPQRERVVWDQIQANEHPERKCELLGEAAMLALAAASCRKLQQLQKFKRCGRCKVRYCSVPCSAKHWPTHKRTCVGTLKRKKKTK